MVDWLSIAYPQKKNAIGNQADFKRADSPEPPVPPPSFSRGPTVQFFQLRQKMSIPRMSK
jgi:hypothetical protein